jgi:hypothetical protein
MEKGGGACGFEGLSGFPEASGEAVDSGPPLPKKLRREKAMVIMNSPN